MQHHKMNWEMFPPVLFSDIVCVELMFPSLMLDKLGHRTHLGLEFSWSGFFIRNSVSLRDVELFRLSISS